MARMPRVVVPGVPMHVTQRGNNRQSIFFSDRDRATFLVDLSEAATHFGCAVHAYVLMTNHVHLLLTPWDGDGPSRLMQVLGGRYCGYLNRVYRRTGTMWDGRFRSVPLHSDHHFLACSRYIEMNPVRAGIVAAPSDYRWSSFRGNALGEMNAVLTPHPLYLSLGRTPHRRRQAYQALFGQPSADADPPNLSTGVRPL